ncbi:MAG: TonB-dependent receptor [Tidjanibacter sp.]|nr:TonB-dependent receptor [Tidjanibacter sp.]
MKLFTQSFVSRSVLLALMLFATSSLMAQSYVRGVVKDEAGEPVIGATVVVQGTTVGTSTDYLGNWHLNIPKDVKNPMLLFQYLGMKDLMEAVGGRTQIDVVMTTEADVLDDVVVVGYGVQRKGSLTASISSIDGDELQKAPATNVTSMLGGRIAGIASVQESGEPGMDGASLTVRGSYYGVTYIVDGVPRALDDINPNDIASISVLKDAAAASVYGLNSAGGVIIVTTKSGKEGKNELNYTGSVGVSVNANFPDFLNAEQFAWYYNKGREMDGMSPIFTAEQVALMTNGDDSDGWGDTNWIDEVFGVGMNTKHNISTSGGNDKVRYFASLGYMNQHGNISAYTYEKYNIRANINSQVSDNLTLKLTVAGGTDNKNNPGFSSGGSESDGTWMSVARQAVASHPYLPKTYQGLPTATPNNIGQGSSPIAAVEQSGYNRNEGYEVQTNIELEYKSPALKGLTARVMGSFDHGYSMSKILATPVYVMLASLPTDGSTQMNYSKVQDVRGTSYNTLGEGIYSGTSLLGNAQLQYVTKIGEDHDLDVMVVGEMRQYKARSLASYGKELPFIELPELGFATPSDSPISGSSSLTRQMGFVGRLRYAYADKYMLEATARYDGSYKFAGNIDGKRWGLFPAISLGWRISEEEFLLGSDEWLENLKFRLSAGEVGVDDVSAYGFLNQYGQGSPVYLGGNRFNTLAVTSIANLNLTWARTRSFNVGLDASFWRGLLGFELDLFYTHTYDMLTYMGGKYPPSMGGYYPVYENFGEQDSRGLELVLTHKNSIGEGANALHYNVALNLTYAYARWLKYTDKADTPDYQCYAGQELGAMLGWVADGLYQSEEEIDNSPWPWGQRPRVGDIKYVDLSGNGIVDYEDKAFTGRSNRPKLTAGLNLSLSWRNFDFATLITGAAMFDISLTGTYYNGMDDNTIFTETFKEGGNSPVFLVENAWREDNPNGTYPRLTVNAPTNNNGLASTFWFRDGKYLRVKSVQLGYNLTEKACKRIGLSGVRLYVEGANLLTLSGLPEGIDPESPGVNNGYYPQQKTFMGGISITF